MSRSVLTIASITVSMMSMLWGARHLRRIAWRARPSEESPQRIVILGGGYVGLYTALRLQRTLRRGRPRSRSSTHDRRRPTSRSSPKQRQEASSQRHAVVSLRRRRLVTAAVSAIDTERRFVTAEPAEGPPVMIPYDHVVIGLGSIEGFLPVPGLADEAFGFQQIEDAVALRNHVLDRSTSPARRPTTNCGAGS